MKCPLKNEEELRIAGEEYKRLYGGASYYDIALEIADTYPLQASIIILATWNTGRFRYLLANNAQNLAHLQSVVEECKPLFAKVRNEEFQSANFDEIGDWVKHIYSKLSAVEGVKYTGASKVMHLLSPRLFLIWDSAMRKHYGYSGANTSDYLEYHKRVQEYIRGMKWCSHTKTLPKAIDEYHYVTITRKRKLP